MNIKQLEYASTVGRVLSFSKAAKELYVSQPNISNSLSQLEKELGYKIFLRTNQGIRVTYEGSRFLQYATNALSEINKINDLKNVVPQRKFSAQIMFNHTIVSCAFTRLCNEFSASPKLDFSLNSSSISAIVDGVYMGTCQIGLALMSQTMLDVYTNSTNGKNLTLTKLCNLSINVNVRKGHPLLQDSQFAFDKLHEYPYVNYIFTPLNELPDVFALGLVDPDKVITVAERETRVAVVANTNSFSLGCTLHPTTNLIGQMYSIPLPGVSQNVVLIHKNNLTFNDEAKRFIEILREEFDSITVQSNLQYKKTP